MATIQVRELPEATYEVLRRRARRAGMSLQAYMRDELVHLASQPTKQEAIEQVERVLGRSPTGEISRDSLVSDLLAERR